jgi:choice-of-anchor B domain-containing protein
MLQLDHKNKLVLRSHSRKHFFLFKRMKMKKFFACLPLFACLFAAVSAFAQTNVTHLSTVTFNNQKLSNVWGYTANGSEYALVGGFQGTTIVDITNPAAPVNIVTVAGPNSDWREIKTYENFAYVVSEGGGGVQIIDLSNLPNNNPAHYSYFCNVPGFGNMNTGHALHVDETAGFLYVYGSNINGGRPVVINLEPDPYNPTYAGRLAALAYAHDGYADGDFMYAGHIFAGQFSIVNFTNKASPVVVATQPTPGAFTHNTWLSGSTLFTTDEVSGSFLTAYDISNTNNIRELDRIRSNPGSGVIAHNTYITNTNYAVTSWYKDGFTIVDVDRPANMVQVGNFDTYPNDAGTGFEGCWGVYPYFPSGTIIASNIRKFGTNHGELMVFSPTYVRGCYLEGVVRNTAGVPLTNAQVEIINTTVLDYVNNVGEYKVGLLTPGTYTARASKQGYFPQDIVVSLGTGQLTLQDFNLVQIPLPVELTKFEVQAEDYTALLRWETSAEVGNAGFEVQYAPDALSWAPIGFVKASGAATGKYSFRSKNLKPGVHYFRLKQIDLDGKFKMTDWVSCLIDRAGLQVALQPNLVQDQSTLKIHAAQSGDVHVELFSASMQALGQQWTFSVEKDFETSLQLQHLPTGKYFLMAHTGQERAAIAFIKE